MPAPGRDPDDHLMGVRITVRRIAFDRDPLGLQRGGERLGVRPDGALEFFLERRSFHRPTSGGRGASPDDGWTSTPGKARGRISTQRFFNGAFRGDVSGDDPALGAEKRLVGASGHDVGALLERRLEQRRKAPGRGPCRT